MMKVAGVANDKQAGQVGQKDLNSVESFHCDHHFYVLGNWVLLVLCRGAQDTDSLL